MSKFMFFFPLFPLDQLQTSVVSGTISHWVPLDWLLKIPPGLYGVVSVRGDLKEFSEFDRIWVWFFKVFYGGIPPKGYFHRKKRSFKNHQIGVPQSGPRNLQTNKKYKQHQKKQRNSYPLFNVAMDNHQFWVHHVSHL